MYSYTVTQWLFFFYFYSFFGWCFESTYVSLKNRKPVNRGFLRGPFLPLYGSGGIMMLVVSMPFQDNIWLVYLAGVVGATLLEYVTGVAMETLFKVRYWDYSKNKFNFQGHICLGSSLVWGLLTIFMTECLHKLVERMVLAIPEAWLHGITLLLTAIIWSDFALSFKAAMDLRDVLVRMEKAKQEMLRIQKRLDVIIALTNEDISNRREELSENIEMRIEDVKEGIEGRLERLKKLAHARSGEHPENFRAELGDLRERYLKSLEDRERLVNLRDLFQRNLIRSNPTMSSTRFKEALEELKERVDDRKKK